MSIDSDIAIIAKDDSGYFYWMAFNQKAYDQRREYLEKKGVEVIKILREQEINVIKEFIKKLNKDSNARRRLDYPPL